MDGKITDFNTNDLNIPVINKPIFTSYIAQIRKAPTNYLRILICRYVPIYLSMYVNYDMHLVNLAPSEELLKQWKAGTLTKEEYKTMYLKQLTDAHLSPLDLEIYFKKLSIMANVDGIILYCYEKSGEFCHRHILAEYINSIMINDDYKITEIIY
jgi:uncharacterized protein YeaO (DUF488 family)